MKRCYIIFLLFVFGYAAAAQPGRLQFLLDSLRIAGGYPGLSAAIITRDHTTHALVSGYNDAEKKLLLQKEDRMLQGSVGKTYVSAIALRLVKEGRLKTGEKVSAYLGHQTWYHRLPNAESITVGMLMNHTSGIMRYEFKPAFTRDLSANPSKVWKPEELLAYVLDEKASFPAGEGWEYSDTNYILLGMIIEALSGKKYYELLQETILQPLKLENTFPSDKRLLPGLAQGYAGEQNEFGGKDRVIGDDGLFIINPQFEWTGGGIYSSTMDLARWGKLLYEGNVVDTSMLFALSVPAKLGRDTYYGAGVIIRKTALGTGYGHSGFFPGYLTELLYFPDLRLCIAVQANSSDFRKLKIPLMKCLLEMAKTAAAL